MRGVNPAEYEQWSQEFQLVFPQSGRVGGLLGAYYADSDTVLNFHQTLPLLNPEPLNDLHSTLDEPAAALFGQVTVQLAGDWSATGGLRLSRETHRVSMSGTGVQDSPIPYIGETDSDDVSWRVDLQHAVNDDVMIYAGVSTGYKSGGYVPTSPLNGIADEFGPEYLTAYEAGGKSQLLDGRLALNVAAFVYDFEDLQVSRTVLDEGQIIVDVQNAASAELYGIDTELDFHANERFSVSAGAVWLPKREFVEFDDDVTGDTLTGNDLVRAPEWTGIAAINYEHALQQFGALSWRLEYSYRSGYYYTPDNNPVFSQDSFGLLNLFLKFEAASEEWYAFAAGRNLTDENYFNQVFFQSSPGYPDTYEVGIGYRF